jgi:hypothetical protein
MVIDTHLFIHHSIVLPKVSMAMKSFLKLKQVLASYSPRLRRLRIDYSVGKQEHRRRGGMKNAILAVVITASVGGFVSSSDAQDVKKLRPHPDAAADQSLQRGNADLPTAGASHPGGASLERAKPKTGAAVSSGGTSTGQSKQN